MLGLLLCSRVPLYSSVLMVITLGNHSISRGPHDRETMSTSPYRHWCGMTFFRSGERQIFPLLTHAFGPWITVKTPGLIPSKNMLQKLVSICFIPQRMFQADTLKSCFLFVISTLQQTWCRNLLIPQNLHDDVMCTFNVDAKALHDDQTAPFDPPWHVCPGPKRGVNDWGMPSPQCCSYPLWISCTSQRLLYAAKSRCHTHTSFKNECVPSCIFCAQKLDDAALCVIGQICDSCPLCRHYSEQSAYDICLSWSVVTTDHCQTAQEWSTLHYTEPDNTRCLFILQQTLYFCSGSHNKMSITLKQWTSSPRKHTDVSQGVCWWGMWLYC